MRAFYRKTILGYMLLLLLCTAQISLAAAWLQEKGRSQLIVSTTFFKSDEFFDVQGNRNSQPEFTKLTYDFLYEYGLNDNWTIGVQPRYDQVRQLTADGFVNQNSGLASIDFWARRKIAQRYNLLQQGDGAVLSAQSKLVLPGKESRRSTLPVSTNQIDAEFRVLAGYSFKAINDLYHYVNLEAAVKKRFETPSDEWALDLTLGTHVAQNWQILAQIFHTESLDVGGSGLSLAATRDFSLTSGQLSVVRKFSDRYSMQVGVFDHLRGRNTGRGQGMLASLWIHF